MFTIKVMTRSIDEGPGVVTFTGNDLSYMVLDGGELQIFGKDERNKRIGALFAVSCWSNVTTSED